MTVSIANGFIFNKPVPGCCYLLCRFCVWIVWEENEQQPQPPCADVSGSQGPGEQGKACVLTISCDITVALTGQVVTGVR